jgi:zinc protease
MKGLSKTICFFYNNMASQPSFYFQQELYGYLMKENPRFNGLIQRRNLGSKQIMS